MEERLKISFWSDDTKLPGNFIYDIKMDEQCFLKDYLDTIDYDANIWALLQHMFVDYPGCNSALCSRNSVLHACYKKYSIIVRVGKAQHTADVETINNWIYQIMEFNFDYFFGRLKIISFGNIQLTVIASKYYISAEDIQWVQCLSW